MSFLWRIYKRRNYLGKNWIRGERKGNGKEIGGKGEMRRKSRGRKGRGGKEMRRDEGRKERKAKRMYEAKEERKGKERELSGRK